ncbi:hypothetical protein ACLVWU_14605 [Bdellovibrio sp. HCB290]|uniref:hypothetical protein n=1 Tax=Bdellovibrio sp. HCB290 TaxID=3394356 RepID=UPI0039B3F96A
MKTNILSITKKIILIAGSLLSLMAHAEESYDTISKQLVQAQESARTVSSRTSADISQAMFNSLTYLDTLARSGQTDTQTLDRAENMAKLLGETFFVILRHQGIDPEKVDRDMTSVEKAAGVLREMMYDASRLVSFQKDSQGKRVWGVSSASAREALTQDAAAKIAGFVDNTVQSMDSNSVMREDFLLKFNYVLERSIKVKETRAGQQKMARFAYLGLAVLTFIHPPLDLVIERTYYSSFYSGIIYMSSFLTMFAVKTKMSGVKTIEILKQVAADVKNPAQAVDRIRTASSSGKSCTKIFNN